MAWFLGLIGFFFMLSTLLAPDWLIHDSTGPFEPFSVDGAQPIQTSWGLTQGCVLITTKNEEGEDSKEWKCDDVQVKLGEEASIGLDQLIARDFGWLASVSLLITFGEVFLVIALVIVFVGLCCPFKWRFAMFRSGMYLYLLADLLFLIALIVFPAELKASEPDRPLSHTIGWCYGMGWGVVIIVFTGALLLLLDKDPPKKSVPEDAETHA